jgi:branched-chain amino acid transport system permease protein
MSRTTLRLAALCTVAAGAGLVALAQAFCGDYYLSILDFVGIAAVLAVSLNITNGFTGLFSLGHPAFMAIGGYVTALLVLPAGRKEMFLPDLPAWLASAEWSFAPALAAGGLAAVLAACLVGLPVLRLKGHYLAVATMGFLIIVQVLIVNLDWLTRGPLGLNGLAPLTDLWWVYAVLVVTLYVAYALKFSSLGRAMLAVREDELAARCLGIPAARARIMALAVGAFFAGVSGGLWAHLITAITPGSFSLLMAFTIVAMVVIGGSGSVTGSLLAAVGISLFTEALKPVEESLELYGLAEIVMALGLIVCLVLRPRGLFGSEEPRLLARLFENSAP